MNRNYIWLSAFALAMISCGGEVTTTGTGNPQIVETLIVDNVWAANRVNFDLHTAKGTHFVAYYDKDRYMTVASCKEGSNTWTKTKLPNKLMWDSHNYVTLGIDPKGYIHVSGNMHVNPLAYFRSAKPYDVSEMLTLNSMIGDGEEERVTYPNFFNSPNGDLYYSYRSGTCGDGNILVNRFNPSKLSWSRYLNEPLFLGVEEDSDRAAYHKFIIDNEGTFHYVWMWRWTPLVETCHQLCYATTKDLKSWQNGAGESISLPFRPDTEALIVDGVATNGGLHNGKYEIITSADNRPYIAYLKYDESGNTQLYLTSFINGKWVNKVLTDWNFRWHFEGGGDTMSNGATFTFDGFSEDGFLVISWRNEIGESGRAVVDANSLTIVDGSDVIVTPKYPKEVAEPLSNREMNVQRADDDGASKLANTSYLLKWEACKPSHGKHKPEVMPEGPTSELLLLKIER